MKIPKENYDLAKIIMRTIVIHKIQFLDFVTIVTFRSWFLSYIPINFTLFFFSELNPDNRQLDGCRVHGSLDLNKVAGNFHITAGK